MNLFVFCGLCTLEKFLYNNRVIGGREGGREGGKEGRRANSLQHNGRNKLKCI